MEDNAKTDHEWYKVMEYKRIGKKQWTSKEPVNPLYPFDDKEGTLLHIAVCGRNLPLVKFILEFEEGDKNPPAADGVTPLRLEIISGQCSIIKEILQHVSPARSQARGIHLARPWVNALQLAIKKAE